MSIALNGLLVLAGAGKMGGALLTGMLSKGLPGTQVLVQDPVVNADDKERWLSQGVTFSANIEQLPSPPAVLLAAVKPQVMDDVFPELAKLAGPDTLTLSIAAGKTIASFAEHLPPSSAIVRAMPNTPAAIGHGMTVCAANEAVTSAQRSLATDLLTAAGDVAWVDDEAMLDPVTAVSGSGPAYVFLLTQYLAEAGQKAGLPQELAEHLARKTVTGSAALMAQSQDKPAQLRTNVTSPGGTTAAALDVLMAENGLAELMDKAIAAAAKRSQELSK